MDVGDGKRMRAYFTYIQVCDNMLLYKEGTNSCRHTWIIHKLDYMQPNNELNV
jgi:hypothetical protein